MSELSGLGSKTKQNNTLAILLVIVLVIVVAIAIFFFFREKKKKKLIEMELDQSVKKLNLDLHKKRLQDQGYEQLRNQDLSEKIESLESEQIKNDIIENDTKNYSQNENISNVNIISDFVQKDNDFLEISNIDLYQDTDEFELSFNDLEQLAIDEDVINNSSDNIEQEVIITYSEEEEPIVEKNEPNKIFIIKNKSYPNKKTKIYHEPNLKSQHILDVKPNTNSPVFIGFLSKYVDDEWLEVELEFVSQGVKFGYALRDSVIVTNVI